MNDAPQGPAGQIQPMEAVVTSKDSTRQFVPLRQGSNQFGTRPSAASPRLLAGLLPTSWLVKTQLRKRQTLPKSPVIRQVNLTAELTGVSRLKALLGTSPSELNRSGKPRSDPSGRS